MFLLLYVITYTVEQHTGNIRDLTGLFNCDVNISVTKLNFAISFKYVTNAEDTISQSIARKQPKSANCHEQHPRIFTGCEAYTEITTSF
jgi:hypothetical protein